MTEVMASLFVDIHLSKAKLTLSQDGNCFLIASMVSEDSLRQMLLMVMAGGSTRLLCNAIYDCHSSKFTIAFLKIWVKIFPNMRWIFHMSQWNSEISKSLAASLEHFVCHFGQYGLTWMWNISFLWELTIVIPQLPCRFRMARAVSPTVELVNSVT